MFLKDIKTFMNLKKVSNNCDIRKNKETPKAKNKNENLFEVS